MNSVPSNNSSYESQSVSDMRFNNAQEHQQQSSQNDTTQDSQTQTEKPDSPQAQILQQSNNDPPSPHDKDSRPRLMLQPHNGRLSHVSFIMNDPSLLYYTVHIFLCLISRCQVLL